MPVPETAAEKEKIEALRAELKEREVVLPETVLPCKNEDATLLRFLRARKFDITAAADQLETSMKWRQENEVDDYLTQFLPSGKDQVIRRCMPTGWLGFDKLGLPVWMEHPAAMDIAGMEAAGVSLDDICFYQVRGMEYMIQCKFQEASKHSGRLVDSHSVILDVGGLRMGLMSSKTINVFRAISILYQAHYPELMTRMYIVNIPLIFGAMWKVASMIIDDRVKAKIRFLKKSELGQLYEFIDRDQLPKSLGGTRQNCLSTHEGFIPDSLLAVDAEIKRRQAASSQAVGKAEPAPAVAPAVTAAEAPPTPPLAEKGPPTSGGSLLGRMSMRFRKPSISHTPNSRIGPSESSFQTASALAARDPSASATRTPHGPPTGSLPLSPDSVSLAPALPAGVVQAVHRLDHHPQVSEHTLLRQSMAPHIHRPSHMGGQSRQPSGEGLLSPSRLGTTSHHAPHHSHEGTSMAGNPRLVRSSIALAQGDSGSSRTSMEPTKHTGPGGPFSSLGGSQQPSHPPGVAGPHSIAPHGPGHQRPPSGLDWGLLDADELDALDTLRRTDSAPNLAAPEKLPFRQRRAQKKAVKRAAKASKVKPRRRFMCCSVPATLHEDDDDAEDLPDAPSDSAVSMGEGFRGQRGSQTSLASGDALAQHDETLRPRAGRAEKLMRIGRSPSMPNMKLLDTVHEPVRHVEPPLAPAQPTGPRITQSLRPTPRPTELPLTGLVNIPEERISMRSNISADTGDTPLSARVVQHEALEQEPRPLSARRVHTDSAAASPPTFMAALDKDDAIHSTYQNRFEPQVQPVKPPMPPEPTSHPQHPTKDPPGRPWEVHRLPTGHYQWLGDRVKQALLLLALLGLVVQLCTLQPYRGPGSSPFGPKIGRQAPQPRLYQGVNTLAAGAQDMGSSLTSSAAHAVQQAQQAVGLTGSTSAGAGSGGIAAVTEGLTGASQSLQGAGSSIADAAARAAQQVGQAGAAAAGAAVGAAQGLQQRGADSAQKLQAAAVQGSQGAAGTLQAAGQSAAASLASSARSAQEAAGAAAGLAVGATLGLQQRASDALSHSTASVTQAASTGTAGAGAGLSSLARSVSEAAEAVRQGAASAAGLAQDVQSSVADAASGAASAAQQGAASAVGAASGAAYAVKQSAGSAAGAAQGLPGRAAAALQDSFGPAPPPGLLQGAADRLQAGAEAVKGAFAAPPPPSLQERLLGGKQAASGSFQAMTETVAGSLAQASGAASEAASSFAAAASGAASGLQQQASDAASSAADLAASAATSVKDATAQAAHATLDRASVLQQQAAATLQQPFAPAPPPTALQAAQSRLGAAFAAVTGSLSPPPPPSALQQAGQSLTAGAEAVQAQASKLLGLSPDPAPSISQQAAQSARSAAEAVQQALPTLGGSPPSWRERLWGAPKKASLAQKLPEVAGEKLQSSMAQAQEALGKASQAVREAVAGQSTGGVAADMMGQMNRAVGGPPESQSRPSGRFSRLWRG